MYVGCVDFLLDGDSNDHPELANITLLGSCCYLLKKCLWAVKKKSALLCTILFLESEGRYKL